MWTTGPGGLMGQELQCAPQTGGEKPRAQAPVSVGASGETLADLPEGEETFSVNLGPLLVILVDRPLLPLLCGSQHPRTTDLFRETSSSRHQKLYKVDCSPTHSWQARSSAFICPETEPL